MSNFPTQIQIQFPVIFQSSYGTSQGVLLILQNDLTKQIKRDFARKLIAQSKLNKIQSANIFIL